MKNRDVRTQGKLQRRGGPTSRMDRLPGGLPPDKVEAPTVSAVSRLLNYLEMVRNYPRMNFVELRRLVPMMRAVVNPSEELRLILKGFEVEFEVDNGAVTSVAALVAERPESLMQVLLRMQGE